MQVLLPGSALMQYKGLSLEEAAYEVVQNKLKPAGGSGGVICVDKNGNISMEFNSTGMMRAWANSKDERGVKVFE